MDTEIKLPTAQANKLDALEQQVSQLQQLNAQYKRSTIIQDALLGISNVATEATSLEHFYQGVHQYLKQIIPADNFYIASRDQLSGVISLPFFADEKDSHPSDLYPEEALSSLLESGITGYVLRQGKPILAGQAKFDELVADGSIRNLGTSCHQLLAMPIRNQRFISGVLVVQTYNEQINYGELELELMSFISHHISGVMERLQHQEQLEVAIEQRTKELSQAYDKLKAEVNERVRAEQLQKALFEIANLSAANEYDAQFYAQLHLIISRLLPAKNSFIALKQGNELSFPFYVSQIHKSRPMSRPLKDGLTEYLLELKKPVLLTVDDIQQLIDTKKIYYATPELNKTANMHQWIGVPLIIEGEVKGIFTTFTYDDQHQYSTTDVDLLVFVSQHIANAIERKQAVENLKRSHEELEDKVKQRTKDLAASNQHLQSEIAQRKQMEAQLIHDAQHDSLTGLPNRSYLIDRLNQAVKHVRRHSKTQFALLFLDLDRFKQINDTLGHLAGDEFLIETAKRLTTCIRENDTLARMGGDEFVILLDSISSKRDAKDISERILKAIAAPYWLANKEFISGASIGIAYSSTSQSDTSESILRNADKAMYQAKANGKGCYVVFDEKLGSNSRCEKQLEQDYKQALDNQLFEVSCQEIIDLTSGEIVAIEPKLSWTTPEDETLSHQQIRELAQHYQLSRQLDGYVFDHLNANYNELKQQYGCATQLHMVVSCKHLKNKFAFRGLKKAIRNSKLDLTKLVLFFNEKALVQDLQNHTNAFDTLAKFGVKLGIGNYGLGYSAITNLHYLPVYALKLDDNISQSVMQQQHQKLLKAYNLSAQAMEFKVFAAGVNSHEIAKLLIELGYQFGQGSVCKTSTLECASA
ncbi:diguanylate cyclase [Shewanella maritima]|uniref:Diguanylate cyclase n=1 Tax=Shewanella maritima TaxID=2520507 RepID=A0A411PJ88_9GAMM|nr:diguanylate cyclase [Shewanella maritima]QBF83492.1 diguanylate cyclase [Shewanella maritima]